VLVNTCQNVNITNSLEEVNISTCSKGNRARRGRLYKADVRPRLLLSDLVPWTFT
jgi:hypothetical protein